MTNLKDKLSASVRQAKAEQRPATKPAAKPAVSKAALKKAPAQKPVAKPAVRKAVAPTVVASKPVAPKPAALKSIAAGVADSSNVLFPDRVWPD